MSEGAEKGRRLTYVRPVLGQVLQPQHAVLVVVQLLQNTAHGGADLGLLVQPGPARLRHVLEPVRGTEGWGAR